MQTQNRLLDDLARVATGALGVADDPRLPDTWSTTENVTWATEIPGRGWSSPIVAGDLIVLTSVISSSPEEAPKKGLYFGGERPVPKVAHRWLVYGIDWDTGEQVVITSTDLELFEPFSVILLNLATP